MRSNEPGWRHKGLFRSRLIYSTSFSEDPVPASISAYDEAMEYIESRTLKREIATNFCGSSECHFIAAY
jgi:hypothetical protein